MFLQKGKKALLTITADDIEIKTDAHPALGTVREENGRPKISLKQKIISNPAELLEVYTHEVGHYLSDEDDYVLDFQRFLMAIAASRIIPSHY